MATTKYLTIYRKAKFGIKPIGDLSDVRVGDIVKYWDDGSAAGHVAKVNIKAGQLRTAPNTMDIGEGNIVETRRAKRLLFDEILEIQREDTSATDGSSTSSIMDLFHQIMAEPEPAKRKRGRG